MFTEVSENFFSYVVCGALLFFTSCSVSPEVQPKNNPKPFLYTLEKNGVRSYVLGTIHFGVALKEVESEIHKIFKQTKVHFYEKILPRSNVTYFGRISLDPLNLYRSELYSTAVAQGQRPLPQKAVRNLVTIGVPASVAVSMGPEDCEIVYHRRLLFSGKSMDFEALGTSYDLQKRMIQLDTPELRKTAESLDVDSGMDFSCRVEDLVKNLSELRSIDQTISNSLKKYLSGDESEFQNSTPGVDYRNRDWIRQIIPIAKKQSSLIVVGVSHLLGPHGLFEEFRKRGFRVQRVEKLDN